MSKLLKIGANAIWICALLFGFWRVATKTKALSDQHYQLLEPPPLTQLDPSLIDIITLGFRPAYDDFVTIWTMQFLFDGGLSTYDAETVHRTLLMTTRNHPKSSGLYLSACFYLAFNRTRPDLCEAIILDGLKAVPNDWRLPATQGFMEAFQLKNVSKAVVYYSIAANIPGSPAFMKSAVSSLERLGKIDTNTLDATLRSIAGDGSDSSIANFIEQVVKNKTNRPEPANEAPRDQGATP